MKEAKRKVQNKTQRNEKEKEVTWRGEERETKRGGEDREINEKQRGRRGGGTE